MKFEIDYIEKLAKIVSKNELSEICLEDSEKAITIRKEKEVVTASVAPIAAAPAVSAPAPVAPATETTEAAPAANKGTPITSPMVGTFYQASAPGAEPFVKVGDSVASGKVVCIIEAMKLMNEIEAEVSGKITEICVADGEPVEFGQVLMYVE